MKKFLFAVIIVALWLLLPLAGPSQTSRPLNDMDMFVNSTSTGKVLPNVCILADNSGSMNSAIFHPSYNASIDYSPSTYTLDRNTGRSSLDSGSSPTLSSNLTFKICRGGVKTISKRATGTYQSRVSHPTNPNYSNWTVQKTSTDDFVAGKTIVFSYKPTTGNAYNKTLNIIDVQCVGNTCIITVDSPTFYPNRSNNRTVTSNYTITEPIDNYAKFISNSDTCTTGAESYTITLYGTQEGSEPTRYELNYLFWLAFFATPQELIEVNNWATTGNYPDESGTPVFSGYTRIQVLRQVLADVVTDTYKMVNYGLFVFDTSDTNDSAGGHMREPMSNKATGGTLNDFINNKIMNISAESWTPLAEAMADIWVYFRGGVNTNYLPATTFDSNCGHGTGGGFPTSCPIQYYCQKNYVIIMTDGQSTKDTFENSKFGSSSNCLFKKDIATWGDGDNHDPQYPSYNQPTFSDYCGQESCWIAGSGGRDDLDDVAYYLRMNDIFPDANYADMPGMQNILTYAIGFTIHNQLLAETARNGDGQYYTARNYASLKNALKNAIYDILIREFAFASYTAPKKTTNVTGEGSTFVGFFKPSAADPFWEGFLQSYNIMLIWCPDLDNSGGITPGDCAQEFASQWDCENVNPGVQCLPSVTFASQPTWKAEDLIKSLTSRSLYTNADTSQPLFIHALNDAAQFPNLKLQFGVLTDDDATKIIDRIYKSDQDPISLLYKSHMGDVFHSDISFVGTPPVGKTFLASVNPPECDRNNLTTDPDCFQYFYDTNIDRTKVVYVGTNDGIMHQFDAVTGQERWGYIPDEVLPSLKRIVIDSKYTFTVDGRSAVDDVYYRTGGAGSCWKTILTFGLKDGGNSFYALDVTSPAGAPNLMWKFNNPTFSGRSWSKPIIGKIRSPSGSTTVDRYVIVLAGGMAFNNEYSSDQRGKAVFVVDAITGELIWLIGYDSTAQADLSTTNYIDVTTEPPASGDPGIKHLTSAAVFNYAIPSAITGVDRDANGYLDTIYFGNAAGHLFKADVREVDPNNWKTYLLYKKLPTASSITRTISSISSVTILTLNSDGTDLVNQTIFGRTSTAMAVVDSVDSGNKRVVSVVMMSGQNFVSHETIEVATFDPIYIQPAVTYDSCYNLWVCFGTGDRIRSRTNPAHGNFFAVKDGRVDAGGGTYIQKTEITKTNLVDLTSAWVLNAGTESAQLTSSPVNLNAYWGFYFILPWSKNDDLSGTPIADRVNEKLFEPEPFVLPDKLGHPHLYFNTYQPTVTSTADACKVQIGKMMFYDLSLNICGDGSVSGSGELGRIAGGGIFGEPMVDITYIGDGTPLSVPPPEEIKTNAFETERGRIFFWKQKQR